MGSYENIVKIEEMRKKVEEGDLNSAGQILNTMDIKKIKNASDLNLMAEVLKENERYDEAADLYFKIYEKSQTRRTISNLIDISIKRGNVEDAQEYLEEYLKTSPDDFDSYVFRYKIGKMKGASYEQLIETLETLRKLEYTEKWEYELAKVYYKAGMEEECIRECSDIILLFGQGVYVEKAKMLRSYYSGEAGKEKIMEELKRRAESPEDFETKDGVSEFENQITSQASDTPDDLEEDICSGSDFMVEHETQEFEDGLKNVVREMLTNELSVENETPDHGTDNDMNSEENIELETENTNYHLPEDDSMEEEDNRLSRIANDFQINPEEIFGDFLQVISVRKQLEDNLEYILQENTNSVFMLITGTDASENTTLAKDMALFLYKTGRINSAKVAKITAGKLNAIDMEAKRENLRSCCVVIENASELKSVTVDSLLELIQYLQGDAAIIFEENEKSLSKLFSECPKLIDILKLQIHLSE